MGSLVRGLGRHQMRGGRFGVRPMLGGASAPRNVGRTISRGDAMREQGVDIGGAGAAGGIGGTVLNAFAKPTGMPMNTGLVSDHPQAQILLAREMFDNDSTAGAVAETLGGIPFGRFSLSGMPDSKHQEPYDRSLDHMRVQTLMPLLATTFLVDGAFLGSGLFDAHNRSWSAMVLHDLMHASILPVPHFGATPIIDVQVNGDVMRGMMGNDPRFARYRRFVTTDMERGIQQLQPENTFYIPRRTMAHHALGQSLFRRIQLLYILEKALARGTIELAYRRQRPLMHIAVGDENWDASLEEMQGVAGLFQNADLDPFGATVVTRPGVVPQEIGGAGDFWKWTDNIDALTSAKLKGLGMPDGLLGGDVALDSVSATLTVFINMMRQFRDYITRAFMYEKMFAYVAVTNGHRKDVLGSFEEHGRDSAWMRMMDSTQYRSVAADTDVDMSEYIMPTVSYHNSMRPEGDRDYLGLLMELQQAGVPVPLRMLAAAGGMDMHDVLNGAPDDLRLRGEKAKYQSAINEIDSAVSPAPGMDPNGGQDFAQQGDSGYQQQAASDRGIHADLTRPLRPRGLANRTYDPRDLPRNPKNGPYVPYTTRRYQQERMEAENRIISAARAELARRENHGHRTQVVRHGPMTLPPIWEGPYR